MLRTFTLAAATAALLLPGGPLPGLEPASAEATTGRWTAREAAAFWTPERMASAAPVPDPPSPGAAAPGAAGHATPGAATPAVPGAAAPAAPGAATPAAPGTAASAAPGGAAPAVPGAAAPAVPSASAGGGIHS
ncbi:hypothetical protein [Streptomyces sp. NPDC089915]|uniref:hypothetical protein n=1 Tax=Streptomyces sp. NPDC089915 TaxID=3155186 RepID=UPI00341A7A0D